MDKALLETDFIDLKFLKRGKVRDVYDLGDSLLMIATDRLSAFDVVMPDPIPEKGILLNRISLFWFDVMKSLIPNHIISGNTGDFPPETKPHAEILEGRSMLVKKAEPLAIECIVRGYLSGSGWKDYTRTGAVCGIDLPSGLKESDRLPEPIFTPSTKAELGDHDENIDFESAVKTVGEDVAEKVKTLSLAIYNKGVELAASKGIIIADTKFEFGMIDGELVLIDEVLTPDSSRFWPMSTYEPGGPQQSFDKQYVRDYLLSIEWVKKPPAPKLPADVIENTRKKYLEAYMLLTGNDAL